MVFIDNSRLNSPDNRKDNGEERYILIGEIFNAIIVVVYTYREKKHKINFSPVSK